MNNLKRENTSKNHLKSLKSLKGYLVFIALSCLTVSWLITSFNYLAVICLIFIWLRLLYSRQLLLLMSCLLFGLLFSCFVWFTRTNHIIKSRSAITERRQVEVLVDPNSLKSDGDRLTFVGKDVVSKENYQIYYRLSSQIEKNQFERQSQIFLLTGTLDLRFPEGQRNLNGFDYRQFLLEQGIYQLGKLEGIEKVIECPAKNPIQYLQVIRRKMTVHIDTNFPKVTASYMKSLFLGIKDSEFRHQKNVLGKLGILHFFSISGLHVTFLAGGIEIFLLRLGITREMVRYLLVMGLLAYLVLGGFSTSVGRSCCYLILRSLNQQFDWHYSELDCWSTTLIISLLLNPYLMLHGPGQLSFGLSFYILYLKPLTKQLPNPWVKNLFFSVVLSLLAIPLMSGQFYEWHGCGILLTLLLTPIFSWVLLPFLSFLICLSLIRQPVILSLFAERSLTRFQYLLEEISTASFFHVVTGKVPLLLILLCVLLSLLALRLFSKSQRLAWFVMLTIVLIPSLAKYGNPQGIIAFVDVGQGESLLIQQPYHQGAVLVDTGGQLEFSQNENWRQQRIVQTQGMNTIHSLLKSRGIKKLDQVFITHAHEDHFGNLSLLTQNTEIKEIIFPEGTGNQPNFQKELQDLPSQIQKRPILGIHRWVQKSIVMTTLYPLEVGDGQNNDSLVLILEVKGQTFLLNGDLEAHGEEALQRIYPTLEVDVLSVGHHGSRTSSTDAFLKQLKSQTGVVSCGLNNYFGHPHQETIQRLEENGVTVYQTSHDGMLYYQWYPWSKNLSDIKKIKKSH